MDVAEGAPVAVAKDVEEVLVLVGTSVVVVDVPALVGGMVVVPPSMAVGASVMVADVGGMV